MIEDLNTTSTPQISFSIVCRLSLDYLSRNWTWAGLMYCFSFSS